MENTMAYSFVVIAPKGDFPQDGTHIPKVQSYLPSLDHLQGKTASGTCTILFVGRDPVEEDIAEGMDAVFITCNDPVVVNEDAYIIFDTGLSDHDLECMRNKKRSNTAATAATADALGYLMIQFGNPNVVYYVGNQVIMVFKGKGHLIAKETTDYRRESLRVVPKQGALI